MTNVVIAGTATGATALPVASSIDGTNDYLPIYTASATATQAISRSTLLGVTGQPADISSTQTLTNKTLGITNTITSKDTLLTLQNAADTSKQAKFQLSGITTATTRTFTLPDATDTLVALAATQTLTNKTLTSPTINTPTITNATITADAVTGFSTSNNGTIYGMSVTGGLLASAAIASQVNTAALQTNSVTAAKLDTAAITLGYAQIVATFTSAASSTWQLVTGLTVTVTIPAGGRRVEIVCFGRDIFKSGGGVLDLGIWDGTVGSGTQLADVEPNLGSGNAGLAFCSAVVTPAAGSKTYNVGINPGSAAAVSLEATATAPAYILVRAI